jgi:hypothetical protein
MANVTAISAEATTAYLRFVECCTGVEIFFRGSLPIVNGQTYSYIGSSPFVGTGGNLETGKCYTIYQEYTSGIITYPGAPTMPVLSLSAGCEDEKCPSCNPVQPCECPPDFNFVDGECVKTTTTSADYSGQLFELKIGSRNKYYCDLGLRLYPDITSMTWPIYGYGASNASYTLNQNNGAGAAVVPTANVQSEVWGKLGNPCNTMTTNNCTGNTCGGRLNRAGVWATNYPPNQELAFEFCITVEGTQPKQYMLGLAGDNYVKFYVDGNLAVFLNVPGSNVTTPFRHWHTFPVTLTPGTHTIKLAGLNLGSDAAFAGEIYDISLPQFQANLMAPAISAGNCGTSEAQLEPFIIFSTRDMVGQSIANPSLPGEWSCPDGSDVIFCNGTPSCVIREKITLTCACYMIIPCDGSPTFISNNDAFESFIDGFITVNSENYTGCAYIVKLEDNDCLESVEAFPDPDIPCDCDLRCFFVENTNGFLYVDQNNVLQEVSTLDAQPYLKVCSKVYPVPENNSTDYQIIELGDCSIDAECPKLCFKLTNCENSDSIIYTNSDTLIPYVYGTNNIVRILNRQGCWIASELEDGDICDCPVDITVTSSYAKCEDCIDYVAYKLISCINNDVIYTLLNLEEYIGQVVKLDCGCYIVEQIDYLPPNPQVVKLEDVYTNCVECTRVYYKLVDCAGIADPIITYTDLSLYVKKVVKIENCSECWEVQETTEHLNATTVNVLFDYANCEECDVDIPCQCSTITNYSIYPKRYAYLDCEYNLVEITLESGQTSERLCVLRWYATDYCDCFILKYTVGDVTEAVMATATGDTLNGYPVYNICTGPRCGTASFNGTNWMIYDENGDPLYILFSPTSSSCPYGSWRTTTPPPEGFRMESYECPQTCNCINLTVNDGVSTNSYNLVIAGYDANLNPIYADSVNDITIRFNEQSQCWELYYGVSKFPIATLCDNIDCPVGAFITKSQTTYIATDCTIPPVVPDFEVTDRIEYFGLCQNGVCPPPVFKNNRTVKPGYNTPICTPEKYDMITCNFADIIYKIVLEKRYGITNCCPEEDDKWLIQKELIDLQALKDPNYNCPECPCSCNSGKTCSTCNCKN